MNSEKPPYMSERFTSMRVEATQNAWDILMDNARRQKKLQDNERILYLGKNKSIQTNFRDEVAKENFTVKGDIRVFSLEGVCPHNHKNRNDTIWLYCQRDFFSCAAATIFTCTAGYTKIKPNKLSEISLEFDLLERPNLKNVNPMLQVEGISLLVWNTMGIIPCMFYGEVTDDDTSNGSFFHDDKNFIKFLRLVRLVSLYSPFNVHWYSLICVPMDSVDEDTYIVLDSTSHMNAFAYVGIDAFKDFLRSISPKKTSYQEPLSFTFYPLIQYEEKNTEEDIFMEKIISILVGQIENGACINVGWEHVISCL